MMLLLLFKLVSGTFVVLCIIYLCLVKYLNGAVTPKSKVCLVGKTAIVTGANRGIGWEVALVLAMRGCRVIVACRSNLEETKQKLINTTQNPNIVAVHLDLLSLDSVRAFSRHVNETEERLDILIHNAVILKSKINVTRDGLNPMAQVSHFAPFLLTHLLVDLMKKTGPGRILFVSSFLSYLNNLTIENLNPCYEVLTSQKASQLYKNNKICNIISAIGFSQKLEPWGITVNAVHPGVVYTSIYDQITSPEDSWEYKLLYLCTVLPFSKTPQEGTYIIIDVVTDERYQNITGKFLFDRGLMRMPKKATDSQFCQKIWDLSEEYVKLRPEQRL